MGSCLASPRLASPCLVLETWVIIAAPPVLSNVLSNVLSMSCAFVVVVVVRQDEMDANSVSAIAGPKT